MKNIDFDNSFSYINLDGENAWRSSISSILYDFKENKNYYLNKECLSEKVDKQIFFPLNIQDFQSITTDKKEIYYLRTSSVNFRGSRYNHRDKKYLEKGNAKILNKIQLVNYEEISAQEVYDKLQQFENEQFFNLINFEIEGEKYSYFFKSNYLNYGKSQFNLQPIYGRVPLLYKQKIYLAYVASHLDKNSSQRENLEILYGNFSNVFDTKNQLSKSFIKRILNFIFPFIYKYNNHLIIQDSEIKFYRKNNI